MAEPSDSKHILQDQSTGEAADPMGDAKAGENSEEKAPEMSKNQRKRLQRLEARRQLQKQKKEDKKRQKVEQKQQARGDAPVDESSTNELDPEEVEAMRLQRRENKRRMREDWEQRARSGAWIAIDCSWEEQMLEREITSLSQQIMFCYGANKRTDHPFHIILASTPLEGRLRRRLGKQMAQGDWWSFDVTDQPYDTCVPEDRQVVYLTADGDEVMERIEDNVMYVIGGIVDRNRLKNVTYEKAKAQNIRTMKLPLKEYVKMQGTTVLTVNHVFEILLKFRSTGSWSEAFGILPDRKMIVLNGASEESQEQSIEQGAEGSEDSKQQEEASS